MKSNGKPPVVVVAFLASALTSCFPIFCIAVVLGVRVERLQFMCCASVATTSLLVVSGSIGKVIPALVAFAEGMSANPRYKEGRQRTNETSARQRGSQRPPPRLSRRKDRAMRGGDQEAKSISDE